jgi:membrane protein YdbS with pleckstrin-like domain
MAHAERLVSPNERIHLITREHGVVLVRPFMRSSLAVLLFGGAAYELAQAPVPSAVRWAGAILAAAIVSISLLGLMRRVGRWNTRRLVVTDRRVLLMAGSLSRRATSVPLHSLHDLQISVSGAGRMLHYGTIVSTANGRRGPLLGLRRLPDPDLIFALLLGLETEHEFEPHPPRMTRRRAFSGA